MGESLMNFRLWQSTLFFIASTSIVASAQVGYCQNWEGREELLAAVEKTFDSPEGASRLSPKERVWIDRKKHQVIVDGYIAINEGQLEMFACPVFTKEHEAVVAVFARSITVHAGLLAVGAETGSTAKWEPEYTAPTGSEIQIQAYWKDEKGKLTDIDARKWVRDLSAKDKSLEPNWVFAGSGFWQDPDTKEKVYNAESGDLICVSNFSTAALDVPIKSTQANAGLTFVAFTKNMPKPATPVRLVLNVVKPKATKAAELSKPEAPKPEAPKPEAPKPESGKTDGGKTDASKAESEAKKTKSDK
jgi:hypothetical protein